MIFIQIIMLNLILAAVIEGYTELRKENDTILPPELMDKFIDKWSDYDPQGTGFISPENYLYLINELLPPLGRKNEQTLMELKK